MAPEDVNPTNNPRCRILLRNPKKSTNLGPILRVASAFGVDQVVMVGYAQCSTHGAHGAEKHVSSIAFPTLTQATDFLSSFHMIGLLMGATSHNNPLPLMHDPVKNVVKASVQDGGWCNSKGCYHSSPASIQDNWNRHDDICLVLSLGGNGLADDLADICHDFVHIPHVSIDRCDRPLLDTQTCLSLALHHYSVVTERPVRGATGFKFDVDENPKELTKNQRDRARRERQDKKLALDAEVQKTEADAAVFMNSLFHDDGGY